MPFRLDRLATLYIVSPLTRRADNEIAVPILMYHSISDDNESRAHPYFRTTTTPDVFATHMAYLHANCYKTCSVPQAVDYVRGRSETTAKHVVITFDDGFRDFYHQAFPILDRHGFTATVFLPTAYIGDVPRQFKGKDCLSWMEVRELNKHGISFGSHTVNHPQLRDLEAASVRQEIVNSKQRIEDKAGCSVTSFAYPYAFPQADQAFVAQLKDALMSAGYTDGVCTVVGTATRQSDTFFLQRLPINSCDDLPLFRAKLNGGYDWLSRPQHALKVAKKWLTPSVCSRRAGMADTNALSADR